MPVSGISSQVGKGLEGYAAADRPFEPYLTGGVV